VADSEKDKSPKKSQPNAFLKYSNVGFVMAAAISLFLYAGMKLDECVENEQPLWTIIGALIGVFAAMYYVIKDFSKK
jgi:ATP synthase protein I